jgi:biopolymer transport protein ExbB
MIALVLKTIDQGGWIMWPIVAVAFVVWWLGLWKLYTFVLLVRARKRFWGYCGSPRLNTLAAYRSTGDDQYDALWRYLYAGASSGAALGARFREFLTVTLERMNAGVSTIAVWVSVAPLLGLLGTVAGMIETFKVITVFGAGNPALTAEGISIALLTTEAGLTVAFPGMLLHVFIANRRNRLQRKLFADGERLIRQMNHGKGGVNDAF